MEQNVGNLLKKWDIPEETIDRFEKLIINDVKFLQARDEIKYMNWDDIIQKWNNTFQYRQDQEYASVQEFITKWPVLEDERAIELINIDFQFLYPHSPINETNFNVKWNLFFNKFLLAKKYEINDEFKENLLSSLNSLHSEDQKIPTQITLMAHLVPPKGRFNRKGKFSTLEALQSLVIVVECQMQVSDDGEARNVVQYDDHVKDHVGPRRVWWCEALASDGRTPLQVKILRSGPWYKTKLETWFRFLIPLKSGTEIGSEIGQRRLLESTHGRIRARRQNRPPCSSVSYLVNKASARGERRDARMQTRRERLFVRSRHKITFAVSRAGKQTYLPLARSSSGLPRRVPFVWILRFWSAVFVPTGSLVKYFSDSRRATCAPAGPVTLHKA
ncbi:hypothetical protein EVAR_94837_1 [Eumeta japonica]|uniref:Uncharacterized protein n=1 Tax=Eumeta variegata TaxID=151549 RepID=A0A4C1UI96_EUMVA|nr:hypothetical protein EVAR_94837_1 [Eumeta japonica]